MAKKIAQKNTEMLLAQQRTDLENLKQSLPLDQIRAAEDKLFSQCLDIFQGALDFDALAFDENGNLDESQLPFEWGALTPTERARRIRLAQYGRLPSKEAPFGMRAAHETVIGIIKARATEKSGTKNLNLEVSLFPAPSPLKPDKEAIEADFEVVDID